MLTKQIRIIPIYIMFFLVSSFGRKKSTKGGGKGERGEGGK